MPCAFCEGPGPLTREHVWPSCFLDRYGRESAQFSVRAGKVHGADYVVADVCAQCNSGGLSVVDGYFCSLYDKYFHEPRDFNSTVTFQYEYELLLRALLKISYNSARSGGSATAPFLPLRSFILSGGSPLPRVAAFAELVAPSIWPGNRTGATQKVLPTAYRASISQYMGKGGDKVLGRMVAVNSFYFHILLPLVELPSDELDKIADGFATNIPGTYLLTPASSEIALATSPQDGLGSMVPHLAANRAQYSDFFRKRPRRKPTN